MSCKGGGNFEVDPRTSETSYGDVSRGMVDTKSAFFGDSWLNPHLATYGNFHVGFIYESMFLYIVVFISRIAIRKNTPPLVFDYLLHKAADTNKIIVKKVEIPILKMKSGKSLSNHEASLAALTLIKTK